MPIFEVEERGFLLFFYDFFELVLGTVCIAISSTICSPARIVTNFPFALRVHQAPKSHSIGALFLPFPLCYALRMLDVFDPYHRPVLLLVPSGPFFRSFLLLRAFADIPLFFYFGIFTPYIAPVNWTNSELFPLPPVSWLLTFVSCISSFFFYARGISCATLYSSLLHVQSLRCLLLTAPLFPRPPFDGRPSTITLVVSLYSAFNHPYDG